MDNSNTTPVVSNATTVTIPAPNMQIATFVFRGKTHLGVNRFSAKAQTGMEEVQALGGPAKSRKKRDPKNFVKLFQEAQYRSKEGWAGVNAACIRLAAISACRTVGFKMTLAKLAIFVEPEGFDREDGTPLLRVHGSEPHLWKAPVRNATGVFDIRPRPRWNPGEWELRPSIRYDAGLFTLVDITNLMSRIGEQVGICEGRPDSKDSAGLGYGLFEVHTQDAEKEQPGRKAKVA